MIDLDNDTLIARYFALRKSASRIGKDIAATRKEIKRRQRAGLFSLQASKPEAKQ